MAVLVVAAGLFATGEAQGREVNTATVSDCLEQETRVRDLDLSPLAMPNPDPFDTTRYTYTLNVDPLAPSVGGGGRRKGRVGINLVCNGPGGVSTLASRNVRLGRNGNLAITGTIPPNQCDAIGVEVEGKKGNQRLDQDTTVVQRLSVTEEFDSRPCTDSRTLCLQDERFQVEVGWRDFTGRTGRGAAFPTSDDAGNFFFFDPDNSELLLKVLDGCAFNDHYWVFYGALTNVEFNVTVTDTQTNQSKSYGNPFGGPAPAITDTQAFATCP